MIRVLYVDIESVLKMNGSLGAPFKVQRGLLSGMLYSLASEPFLHRLRADLGGLHLIEGYDCFKVSAYAGNVMVIISTDMDVSKLQVIVSSAKVNLEKSEAHLVWAECPSTPVLPEGL